MNELRDANRAYGEKLAELGAELPELVVLDADLAACSKTAPFIERFPGRHYNVGIQECNMVGVAAGMAACGKIPFVNSFGMFTAGRAYDQIRNAVVYPGLNVKVVGFYSGLSNGEDGPTHQCVEDLALMRAVPNMVVMCPCDANEAALMTEAAAKHSGPCFIRMGRGPVETVTEFEGYKFEIGKGVVMRPGRDAAIIATGNMVATALKAAALLEAEGLDVRVIDMHTIKPIDRRLVLEAARETGAIVTSEEHNVLGGLGGAVAEVVGEGYPGPVLRHGMRDCFGKSGKHDDVLALFGLTETVLADTVRRAVALKK